MCSLTSQDGGQPLLGVVTVFNPGDQTHACDPKDPALQSRKSAQEAPPIPLGLQEAPPIPLALQEACLRIGFCLTSRWLSPGVRPALRFWGPVRERDRWVSGFSKGRRISLMPLGQGSLGYQAREERDQGPARSFPEADSSILSSCFGSLHNKGGTFTLFGLVYFETFLDEGLGLKELGIKDPSGCFSQRRWLAPSCHSSDLREALPALQVHNNVSAHLLYVPGWPLSL